MFRIARDSLIELDAEVPENVLASIGKGEAAEVTLALGRAVERHRAPDLTARRSADQARPRARATAAGRRIALRRLCAAWCSADSTTPVPAVPEKAVQFEASGPLLLVIDADDRARRVPDQNRRARRRLCRTRARPAGRHPRGLGRRRVPARRRPGRSGGDEPDGRPRSSPGGDRHPVVSCCCTGTDRGGRSQGRKVNHEPAKFPPGRSATRFLSR